MKKVIALTFIMAVSTAMCTNLFAQESDQLRTSATVITDLFVGNKSNALNFGNILVGSSKFLDSENPGGNYVDATASGTGGGVDGLTGDEELGFVSIETNGVVNITVRLPENLKSSSDNTLPVDWTGGGQNGSGYNIRAGVADFTDNTAPTGTISMMLGRNDWVLAATDNGNPIVEATSVDIGAAGGEIFVVVGGQVNAGTNQPTEVYQGNIQVTATIQN